MPHALDAQILITLTATGHRKTDTAAGYSVRYIQEGVQQYFRAPSGGNTAIRRRLIFLLTLGHVSVILLNNEPLYRVTDTGFDQALTAWLKRDALGYSDSASTTSLDRSGTPWSATSTT